MSNQATVSAYPTLTSKIRQRINDLPWRLAEFREQIFPEEFTRFREAVTPYTMLGYGRLRGLYRAVHHAVTNDIAGDIVECGTARGGSAALMGLTLRQLGSDRSLWVFDTFAGLPPPTEKDPDYDIARHFTGTCRGELDEVKSLFKRLGIFDRVCFVEGLFQETLPTSSISSIAVLHVDGDWYESVRSCLEALYDRVSFGGVIQIDDYGHWAGARKAVEEFFKERSIQPSLKYLDYTGRQFVKPASSRNPL